jgi:dTDP-4-amino-4,6-dideoxygalactose transaminase
MENRQLPRKESFAEFVLFGGPASFSKRLHIGCPNIGNRAKLLERFNAILDRRIFSNNGPFVQEFEPLVSMLLGVPHCIATSSGTAALEILTRAVALTGEVLVQSFTFIATAHALQGQGIIGVHLWGEPCDIDRLSELARRRGFALLFDASHAFMHVDARIKAE